MKTPSLIIASITLLAATSAQAIDAEYRRLLERSGCTQVTEGEGCDIHKTKAQNAKAGFGSDADPGAAGGTQVAEQACLAKVAETVNQPISTLKVTEVLAGEAGIGVTIAVPGATAPWSCLSDATGHVQGAMFTGRDGD
jgi:hypothetical protein